VHRSTVVIPSWGSLTVLNGIVFGPAEDPACQERTPLLATADQRRNTSLRNRIVLVVDFVQTHDVWFVAESWSVEPGREAASTRQLRRRCCCASLHGWQPGRLSIELPIPLPAKSIARGWAIVRLTLVGPLEDSYAEAAGSVADLAPYTMPSLPFATSNAPSVRS
jgi:hypothetical protein